MSLALFNQRRVDADHPMARAADHLTIPVGTTVNDTHDVPWIYCRTDAQGTLWFVRPDQVGTVTSGAYLYSAMRLRPLVAQFPSITDYLE